jgi:hypothetical protein
VILGKNPIKSFKNSPNPTSTNSKRYEKYNQAICFIRHGHAVQLLKRLLKS